MAHQGTFSDGPHGPRRDAEEYRHIFQAVMQTNERLMEQNRSLLALVSSDFKDLAAHDQRQPTTREESQRISYTTPARLLTISAVDSPYNTRSNDHIWDDILGTNHNESDDFMQTFYRWDRPPSLPALLNGRRAWTSWSYRASFPELSAFLKRASLTERCPCQVSMEDYYSAQAEPISVNFCKASHRIQDLWEQIKDRLIPSTSAVASERTSQPRAISARLFRIIDLSPVVLACILGSTPQLDLSYAAAFFERHLKLSNWGRVSLLKFKDMSWSSYTFEYHFSFYYMTPEYAEVESTKLDRRKWRKSAPFGREMATKTRYIHEECLSFLLVGHFRDVTTCFQLAESYFKFDPYSRKMESHSFRPFNPDQSPALMLLSWISVGLHHVSWRWQSAIEAVDGEIKSSAQVVFMSDRNDLMADDPQFSLSKTYFWALQAYKLFEKTLLDTIGTWRSFKEHSLPKLRDGRINSEDWRTSIQDIDDAIAKLENKVSRIRTRMAEVKDLRTGLISASALFDSRTSVRQGENIRILTYITILFFPLSFVTSIFSMQFMGSSSDLTTTFAISLPAITFGAALLVFNLENLISVWSNLSDKSTTWLRNLMKHHRREGWKVRAIALHEDLAASKPPVSQVKRQSSAWVYLLFILEHAFLALPLHEALSTFRFLGIVQTHEDPTSQKHESTMIDDDDPLDSAAARRLEMRKRVEEKINQSLQEEIKRERKRRDKERGPILTALARAGSGILAAMRFVGKFLLGIVRALLLPLWIVVLAIEYILVTLFLFLFLFSQSRRSAPPSDDALALLSKSSPDLQEPKPRSIWLRSRDALGLDLLSPSRPAKPCSADIEDPEVQLRIRRVATHLGSIVTPRIGSTSKPSPRSEKEEMGKESPTTPSTSTDMVKEETEGIVRTEYAEDMMKVPMSSNVVTRKVDRGWRFASSGLNPSLERERERNGSKSTGRGAEMDMEAEERDREMDIHAAGHG